MEKDPDTSFTDQHAMSPMRAALYRAWLSAGLATRLKQRRLRAIDAVFGGRLLAPAAGAPLRVLEVGCGSGKDFVRLLAGADLELHGVDLFDTGLRQDNFTFHTADAAALPFEEGSFDLAVSIGVFEHIAPIAKLDQATSEIARVAKAFCVVVPAINTRLEPHFWMPYWQLRAQDGDPGTQYFADHTWRQFAGFHDTRTTRHAYLPGLITNLFISQV